MCCFYPIFRFFQRHAPGDEICMVVATEIIRWLTISVVTFLSVWRYAEYVGYTQFIPGMENRAQFWLVTSLIFLGGSLAIYLPLKVVCSLYWKNARYEQGWRPSMVMYIIFCAAPCLTIILYAIVKSQQNKNLETMDSSTTAIIQALIMGLTITEWMAKMREEVLTFDLTSSMMTDFFFAYDVIDFFMLSTFQKEVYHSEWLYITFVLGFVAMFKYIPNQPTTMNENGTPRFAVTCILVSMFCSDIPFLCVRVITMAKFGLEVSDILHPAKNVAMISVGLTQLYIIYENYKVAKKGPGVQKYSEKRCARHSTLMDDPGENTLNHTPGGDQVDDCTCEEDKGVQMRNTRRGSGGARVSPEHVEPNVNESRNSKI